jgi:hypothetical protein
MNYRLTWKKRYIKNQKDKKIMKFLNWRHCLFFRQT